MAATERPDRTDAHRELPGELANASFVELRVAPSVDALAGAGMLTAALEARGVPFHARVDTGNDNGSSEAGAFLGTNEAPDGQIHIPHGEVAAATTQVAHAWETEDVAGLQDSAAVFGELRRDDRTTDGLGVPLDDTVDGLAHSTLVHGPFSGDEEESAAMYDRVDGDPVDLASLVTLETIGGAGPHAASALERFLAPIRTPDGPFATAAGTADVLDVLGEVNPGLGLALVCGQRDARKTAIRTWKRVATDIHARAESVSPASDAAIATLDSDVPAPAALARVVRDYRTTAPATLVTGPDTIGIASSAVSTMTLASAVTEHATSVVPRGNGRVSATRPDELDAIVSAIREVHP